MPRLQPALLRRGYSVNRLLPLLLRSCRDLDQARRELRWISDHVHLKAPGKIAFSKDLQEYFHARLHQLCVARSKGKPLQYVLGDQPFGDLEILCEPGVLIPRPETEAYTSHLASLVLQSYKADSATLRVLDLCTGTGCIALLFYHLLSKQLPSLDILGIDISRTAVSLARKNLKHNVSKGFLPATAWQQVRFCVANVFEDIAMESRSSGKDWDILISNPPYVSPVSFDRETARSVRNWEPRHALLPAIMSSSDNETVDDAFYPMLLGCAEKSNAKVVVLEVADMAQAMRVVSIIHKSSNWEDCEIWRDWPAQGQVEHKNLHGMNVSIRGQGHGRVVVAWSKNGRQLLN
ncbi:MAG: hypothetical protein LQ342_007834 [Letrouitia transgressa]|nr:MAG: hypothetical protein LQ342_007834 [Letrouitia transgressa]